MSFRNNFFRLQPKVDSSEDDRSEDDRSEDDSSEDDRSEDDRSEEEEEVERELSEEEMNRLAERFYKQSIEDKEEKARRVYTQYLKSLREDREEEEKIHLEKLEKDVDFKGFHPYIKEVILPYEKRFELPDLDDIGEIGRAHV